MDNWLDIRLPRLISGFPLNNIFNADETGLFWRTLPDHTLGFKYEEIRGGKQPKDRVTVLVAASATGEKLPFLTIGRAKQPHCFPKDQLKLPVTYRSNSKS